MRKVESRGAAQTQNGRGHRRARPSKIDQPLPPTDPHDIAAKIAQCMDAPENLAQQREAALDWVAGFDWETTARTIESALTEYLMETKKIAQAPT